MSSFWRHPILQLSCSSTSGLSAATRAALSRPGATVHGSSQVSQQHGQVVVDDAPGGDSRHPRHLVARACQQPFKPAILSNKMKTTFPFGQTVWRYEGRFGEEKSFTGLFGGQCWRRWNLAQMQEEASCSCRGESGCGELC